MKKEWSEGDRDREKEREKNRKEREGKEKDRERTSDKGSSIEECSQVRRERGMRYKERKSGRRREAQGAVRGETPRWVGARAKYISRRDTNYRGNEKNNETRSKIC